MSYRPNRLRRPASPRKIQALRLAGWRYSSKRSAWVHRAFNGRVGPVYVDPADEHPRIDEAIFIDSEGPRRGAEATVAAPLISIEALVAPEAIIEDEHDEVVFVPRPPLDRHRPELARLPLPPRPLDLTRSDDAVRVRVQLSEFEEPRIVRVDGRPPRRGVEPASLAADDHVIVPLKQATAAG